MAVSLATIWSKGHDTTFDEGPFGCPHSGREHLYLDLAQVRRHKTIASWSMVMVHALMVAGPVIVLQLTRLWGPEVDEARVGNAVIQCGSHPGRLSGPSHS